MRAFARQFEPKIRSRSNSTLARPCIWRLRYFKRLTWPSVWPLLHGSVKAARTAAKSLRKLPAKLRIPGALHLGQTQEPTVEYLGTPPVHESEELTRKAANLGDHGLDLAQRLHEPLVTMAP